MRSIERRLKSLEARMGGRGPQVVAIILTGIQRGPDGLEDSGAACATFLSGPNKGLWMPREEGETEAAFLERVDAAKTSA
jgi:hypothetical protein